MTNLELAFGACPRKGCFLRLGEELRLSSRGALFLGGLRRTGAPARLYAEVSGLFVTFAPAERARSLP